jgi:hypothetical protein
VDVDLDLDVVVDVVADVVVCLDDGTAVQAHDSDYVSVDDHDHDHVHHHDDAIDVGRKLRFSLLRAAGA